MMRSMFSGVSGLRSHQVMLDVVSNNIANVNTTGFKGSRVLFADALSQTMRDASGGAFEEVSINPIQVGLGVQVKSTAATFTSGSLQLTDRPLDTAISGDGFYVVNVGGDEQYTRAGSFSLDRNQRLVDGTGGFIQGWMFDGTGPIQTATPPGNLQISDYASVPATATGQVNVRGGLSAQLPIGQEVRSMSKVVDGLGAENALEFIFTKTGATSWTMELRDGAGTSLGTTAVAFDPADGRLTSPASPPTFTMTPATSGAAPFTFSVNLGDAVTGFRQYGSTSSLAIEQDGRPAGELRDFGISEGGVITGRYSNGQLRDIAQIALAHFANNEGLIKTGELHYRASAVSGQAQIGTPGTDPNGSIKAGVLEMSNVDLAREFTDLILAQRGFQASSRVITTSDEMIQELVNLKR